MLNTILQNQMKTVKHIVEQDFGTYTYVNVVVLATVVFRMLYAFEASPNSAGNMAGN